MSIYHFWLGLAILTLVLPPLLSPWAWYPEALSNLRNPMTLLLGISLALLVNDSFRKLVRSLLLSTDEILTRKQSRWLVRGTLVYFLFIFLECGLLSYHSFEVHASDFSLFDYMLFNTSRGKFMETLSGINHFSVHSTPILFFIYPLHRLIQHPSFLLVCHVVVLWSAGIPLYLLMRLTHFGTRILRLLVLNSFYLFVPVSQILEYQFHVEVFYVPLFFWVFYFLHARKWKALFFTLTLTLLIKEDSPFYVFGLSMGSFFLPLIPRRVSLAIAVFSLLGFWMHFGWIIPINSHGRAYQLAATAGGGGLLEIVTRSLTHWDQLVSDLLRGRGIQMSQTFLYLPYFSPVIFISLSPFLLIHTIAKAPVMKDLLLYYSSPCIPFLFWGFLLSLARVQEIIPTWKKWLPGAVVGFVFFHASFWGGGYLQFRKPHPDYTNLSPLIGSMDSSLPICTEGSIVPYLGYPDKLWLLDSNCLRRKPKYVVMHAGLNPWPFTQAQTDQMRIQMDQSKSYRVRHFGGFLLYERV